MWKKLLTAIKGNINEVGENIADSQAVTIIEQHMREAKEEVAKARVNLAKVKGKAKLNEEEIKNIKSKYREYTESSKAATEAGNEELASKINDKREELMNEYNNLESVRNQYETVISKLQSSYKEAEKRIKSDERKLDMLKGQDSLNKASASLAEGANNTNSKLADMQSTMSRFEDNVKNQSATLESLEELNDDFSGKGLDEEIAAAGLGKKAKASELPDSL